MTKKEGVPRKDKKKSVPRKDKKKSVPREDRVGNVTPSVSFVTPSASEGSHGAYAPREDKKKSVPRKDKKGRRASGRQKEKRAWEDKKSRVLDETASTHLAKI